MVEANPADPYAIEAAVQEHRREMRHQTWAAHELLVGRHVVPLQDVIAPGGLPLATTVRQLERRRVR